MTIDEFIEKLRATPRDWFLGTNGTLRCYKNERRCCPLTAVALGNHEIYSPATARIALGLSPEDGCEIIICSDFQPSESDGEQRLILRRRLVDACGLTE